jgi:hypothetical protein
MSIACEPRGKLGVVSYCLAQGVEQSVKARCGSRLYLVCPVVLDITCETRGRLGVAPTVRRKVRQIVQWRVEQFKIVPRRYGHA